MTHQMGKYSDTRVLNGPPMLVLSPYGDLNPSQNPQLNFEKSQLCIFFQVTILEPFGPKWPFLWPLRAPHDPQTGKSCVTRVVNGPPILVLSPYGDPNPSQNPPLDFEKSQLCIFFRVTVLEPFGPKWPFLWPLRGPHNPQNG